MSLSVSTSVCGHVRAEKRDCAIRRRRLSSTRRKSLLGKDALYIARRAQAVFERFTARRVHEAVSGIPLVGGLVWAIAPKTILAQAPQ